MKHELEIQRVSGMSFETELNGHKIVIDADESVGGEDKGPRPKPMLLYSLAGCTGMDVVSLLKKMRVDYDSFKIRVTGELTEEHPKHYHKIHLIYQFKGDNIDRKKVEKAVSKSQDKYCGVSYMLSKAADLSYEIDYL